MKHALITGVTGQDGSYLAELLLEKGYKVYGIMRRKSRMDYGNVVHIKNRIQFIYADMTDMVSLVNAVEISQPDEVYNLAAQSFVGTSWEQPVATAQIQEVHMEWQSCMDTGLQKIIVKVLICLHAAAYYLTMRAREEAGSLLPARLHMQQHVSDKGCNSMWN